MDLKNSNNSKNNQIQSIKTTFLQPQPPPPLSSLPSSTHPWPCFGLVLIHGSPAVCQKNMTAPPEQCQHSHCLVWERKESQAPRGPERRGHEVTLTQDRVTRLRGKCPRGGGSFFTHWEQEDRKRSLRGRGLKWENSGGIRLALPSCDVIGFLAIWAWGEGWRTGGGDWKGERMRWMRGGGGGEGCRTTGKRIDFSLNGRMSPRGGKGAWSAEKPRQVFFLGSSGLLQLCKTESSRPRPAGWNYTHPDFYEPQRFLFNQKRERELPGEGKWKRVKLS